MKKTILLTIVAAFLAAPSFNLMAQGEQQPPKAPEAKQGKEMREKRSTNKFDFKIDPEDEQKLIDSFSAETKQALEVLKNDNPRAYNRIMRRAHFKKFAMMDLPFPQDDNSGMKQKLERHKQMLELTIQTEALGVQYKKAEAAQRTKLKGDLQTKLSQLFDLKEAEQKEEVQNLEKKLKELKDKLQARQQHKAEIVDHKMQEYLGEEDYLEW